MLTREMADAVDAALTVRIATVSKDGVPMVTPLWFCRDGEAIFLGTRAGSFHARHIAANPRVVLLFADRNGRRTRRVLRIAGTAMLAGRETLTPRRKRKMARRYYLQPRAALHWLRNWRKLRNMRRYYAERTDTAIIEVHLDDGEWLEQPLATAAARSPVR